jgi:tetratricopeptide repeat protein
MSLWVEGQRCPHCGHLSRCTTSDCHFSRRTTDGLRRSVDLLQRSIAQDPNYAPAHAALSDAYGLAREWYPLPKSVIDQRRRDAVQKALALDPSSSEAHAALASAKSSFTYDFDFDGAEKEHLVAIQLNPNNAHARFWYGLDLRSCGRTAEAVAEIRKALELDPLSLIINDQLANTYGWSGDFAAAEKQFRHTIELDPQWPRAHYDFAAMLEDRGDLAAALDEYERADQLKDNLTPQMLKTYEEGRAALQSRGAIGYWEYYARFRESQIATRTPADLSFAVYAAAIDQARAGHLDKSLHWIETGYQQQNELFADLAVLPAFEPLRREPRFRAIAQKFHVLKPR